MYLGNVVILKMTNLILKKDLLEDDIPEDDLIKEDLSEDDLPKQKWPYLRKYSCTKNTIKKSSRSKHGPSPADP